MEDSYFNKESNIIISELKKNLELPTNLLENLESIFEYQNRIIQKLNNIVHEYEGESANLDILEYSLKEFKKQDEIAKNLQSSIFPTILPNNDVISISVKLIPMDETSGDFYDFVEIVPNSVYGVLIADISGHGVSAALITNLAKMLFLRATENFASTKDVIGYINKEICNILHQRSYFTAFYTVVDFPNKRVNYSAAGHTFNLRYNAKTKQIEKLTTKDMVIGIRGERLFEEKSFDFNVGDRVIIYTDGISEARNDKKEMFGDERLHNLLLEHIEIPAKELLELTVEEVKKFTAKNTFDDDLTLIIIDIKSDKGIEGTTRSSKGYYSSDEVNRLIKYCEKSIKIKKEHHDKIGMVKDIRRLGECYLKKGKNNEALNYLKKAEKIAIEIKDKTIIGNVSLTLSRVYNKLGKTNEALEYANQSLAHFLSVNNKEKISKTYTSLSIIYGIIGDFEKVKKSLKKALEVEESRELSKNVMLNMAIIYNNFGYAYGSESNIKKALSYFLKSLEFAEKYNVINLQATLMGNIGETYRITAAYEKSLKYLHKALCILEDIDDKVLLCDILHNIALVYFKKAEFELSLYYLNKGVNVSIKYELPYYESLIKSIRAYKYIKLDKINSFIVDAKDCLNINKKIKTDPSKGLIYLAIAIFLYKINKKEKDISEEEKQFISSIGNKTSTQYFFDKAIDESASPMNTDSHIPALYEYALYFYDKGEKEKTELYLKKAYETSIKYENYSEKEIIEKIINTLIK